MSQDPADPLKTDPLKTREAVRTFAVGDLCIWHGFVCRVDKVEPMITGVTSRSLAYMNVADGTELNPTLMITPLYGPQNDPVKRPTQKEVPSGSVEYVAVEIADLKAKAALIQERVAFISALLLALEEAP